MDKVLTHFKNNFAIYAVLLVCLLVIAIALIFSGDKEEKVDIDTSMFDVVDIDEALALFEKDDVSFLVISTNNCSATAGYVPYLQVALAQYGFRVKYFDFTDMDLKSEKMQKLISKLDVDYELYGKKATFGEFMGATPMTVIIKNKKMVFGNIGSMSNTAIGALANNYGFNYNGYKEKEFE
jgi:hypothetical protein